MKDIKREIKFRHWCGNTMYYDRNMDIEFLNKCVVMQYIGLKDSNNKEIYEGDIILFRDIKHKVVYIDQHNNDGYTLNPTMMFYGLELEPSKQDREDKLLYVQTFQWDDQEYYKVIGNIYQNPELFEKENK